jgi:hypothetical protein
MDPRYLPRPPFGIRFIQLDAGDVHLAHHLVMMGLSALGTDVLQALHRFEVYRPKVGGPCITDAPPRAFHQPYDRIFGKFTAGHQGARPFGELPVAYRAAQSFNMLACAGPGPMRDIAFTRLIEPHTPWIWT